MTTKKTIALIRRTFVVKVMAVLFSMLSGLVTAFLPRSRVLKFHGCSHHLQWFWKLNLNCYCFHFLTIYLPEVMGPDHITWLLRNLYAGQEATGRTRHGTTDFFQIGKRVCQGCMLSPCLTYIQSTSWKMLGCLKHKLDSRWPVDRSINSDT